MLVVNFFVWSDIRIAHAEWNCKRRIFLRVSPIHKELERRLDSMDEIHWMKLMLLLSNEFTRIFAKSNHVDCRLCACEYAMHLNLRLESAIVSPCEFSFFLLFFAKFFWRLFVFTFNNAFGVRSWFAWNLADSRVFATTDHKQCAKAKRHAFWCWFLFITPDKTAKTDLRWKSNEWNATHCEWPPIGWYITASVSTKRVWMGSFQLEITYKWADFMTDLFSAPYTTLSRANLSFYFGHWVNYLANYSL